MISVARKSREVKELREAVATQKLTVSKVAKLVSTLNANNAEELIMFAKTHTSREIEAEVARRQGREKEALRKLEIPVSVLEKLKRAQSVLSTKHGCAVDQVATLEEVLDEYLERYDPVRKADRAMKRKVRQTTERAAEQSTEQSLNQTTSDAELESKLARDSSREEKSDRRQPVSAAQAHSVHARDRGRCTFVDANGVRCTNDRWIQRHHVVPVSLGGGNDPANLLSLCPFHHDLVHQLGFPIDGQVNWIREPWRGYNSGGQL